MANDAETQEITQVVVYQPGTEPAIYTTVQDMGVVKIHAGITDGVTKVVIEKKNGERIIFIGLPYNINTQPLTNHVETRTKAK